MYSQCPVPKIADFRYSSCDESAIGQNGCRDRLRLGVGDRDGLRGGAAFASGDLERCAWAGVGV